MAFPVSMYQYETEFANSNRNQQRRIDIVYAWEAIQGLEPQGSLVLPLKLTAHPAYGCIPPAAEGYILWYYDPITRTRSQADG